MPASRAGWYALGRTWAALGREKAMAGHEEAGQGGLAELPRVMGSRCHAVSDFPGQITPLLREASALPTPAAMAPGRNAALAGKSCWNAAQIPGNS